MKDNNVIFIMVDDMRAFEFDHVALTPNIDALRDISTNYTLAYCQESMCNASRSSILTGLRPNTTNIHNSGLDKLRDINPDIVTIPELFKLNGYKTIGYGKFFHHSDSLSWSDFPDFSNRPTHVQGLGYYSEENIALSKKYGRGYPYEKADIDDSIYNDGRNTLEAIKTINSWSGEGSPFFIGIGFEKPHLPFNAPTKYWDLYSEESIKENFSNIPKHLPSLNPDWTLSNWPELRSYYSIPKEGKVSDSVALILQSGYFACLSYIDQQVGLIIEALKENDIFDSSTIVFVSDHGLKLGEYSAWSKHSNYEIDIKVPLLIKYPNQIQKDEYTHPVELVDIFPTLMDIYGLPKNMNLEGESLLNHETKEFSMSQFTLAREGISIRSQQYRYTAWLLENDVIFEEFYDKTLDDYDRVNLIDKSQYLNEINRHRYLVDSLNSFRINYKQPIIIFSRNQKVIVKFGGILDSAQIMLYNVQGQIIHSDTYFDSSEVNIQLKSYNQNIIIAKIIGNKKDIGTYKVLIE
tara:strand:+ start:57158 stop:58720 length:1563 start_codon:yes stop_codon:yes gene_type:complete